MIRLQSQLPAEYTSATDAELASRIAAAKDRLGSRLLVLGHHYQREEVFRWADATGDSFKLARHAADHPEADYVVFCGVHFMAESADVLTEAHQVVVLPDLNAGCSMADMADLDQVLDAWEDIDAVCGTDGVIPITYMNSSAALKAFVGEHGGAVCTSSNARAVLEWAYGEQGAGKVLFFPDQHLGRNTAVAMGYSLDECKVWNPREPLGGLDEREIKESPILLWRGHCSVHQRFRPEHVHAARDEDPNVSVIVHPECSHDVVSLADHVGSTEVILRTIREAPSGTRWAVGTEIHMIDRLRQESAARDVEVFSLDPLVCPCSTMFRIDAPHLAWALESLVDGDVVNQVSVDAETSRWARVALERMLAIT
ncbi:MAG: quinolinate synthase NadA [Acidimicrobiia bacterium]|nr:quinolinate synthase NadA [Acidimicrobiia bacterium]